MIHHDALTNDLIVVSVEDKNLDMTLAERRLYGESRDPAQVKAQTGKVPVHYVLRPLSAPEVVAIESQPPASKALMSFVFGVREIRNFPTPGQVSRPGQRSPSSSDPQRCIWGDDELTSIMQKVGGRRVLEIGTVVHTRALEGNDEGGSIFFEPLRSSLDALQASESRRVALQKSTAAETPSTPAP